MTKIEYLHKAIMESKIYLDIYWYYALLSYTDREVEEQDYSIKYEEDKVYYFLNNTWNIFKDTRVPNKEGLFYFNEAISLRAGLLPNLKENVNTSIGRLILNIILSNAFGSKVPYLNQPFDAKYIEKSIQSRLVDDASLSKLPDEEKIDKIHVQEYLKFCRGCLFLTQLTQVCVPGPTEKALIPDQNLDQLRESLMDKYPEGIHDIAQVADIEKALVDYDKGRLKDDRSMGFYISGKDFDIVRKKMYGTVGNAKGFDGKEVNFIDRPLSEGMDYSKLDYYINESRAGSFSRGAETMLGGVIVKDIIRFSSGTYINDKVIDCGTRTGIPLILNDENMRAYKGFSYFHNGSEYMVDADSVHKDQLVYIRTNASCKHPDIGFCMKCAGPVLNKHPQAIVSALQLIGSIFMNIMMKAMHGKVTKRNKLNLDDIIS